MGQSHFKSSVTEPKNKPNSLQIFNFLESYRIAGNYGKLRTTEWKKIFIWEKGREMIRRGSFLMTSVYTEQCALTWCGNDSIGIGYVMSTRLLYITTEQKMGKTQRKYFGNI